MVERVKLLYIIFSRFYLKVLPVADFMLDGRLCER